MLALPKFSLETKNSWNSVPYIGLKEEHEGEADAGPGGGGSDNTSPSLSFRPPQQRLEREGEGPSLREVLAPFRGSPVFQSEHGWLGASFVSLHHTTIASSFRLPANKWAATPTLPISKFSLISGLQFGE